VGALSSLRVAESEFAALSSETVVVAPSSAELRLVMNVWAETKLSRWLPAPVLEVRRCMLCSRVVGVSVAAAMATVTMIGRLTVCVEQEPVRIARCSSFVVSRWRVASRPRELYETLFQWLEHTVRLLTARSMSAMLHDG
jgi:hypothetical protein